MAEAVEEEIGARIHNIQIAEQFIHQYMDTADFLFGATEIVQGDEIIQALVHFLRRLQLSPERLEFCDPVMPHAGVFMSPRDSNCVQHRNTRVDLHVGARDGLRET